jgi:spore photoproduct lyase
MHRYRIRKLIIDRESARDPLTLRVRERLDTVPAEVVPDARELIAEEPGERTSLILMRHRGTFVKEFTVPRGAPPCGERYLVTMLNCPFSCSYCYLRSYLAHRRLVVFTNTADLAGEIGLLRAAGSAARLTTGELGDSLALDELTGTTDDILDLLRGSEMTLDVRTKSDRVDHLLRGDGTGRRLVITWTLGPREQVSREERGAAPLGARLDAMRRASAEGVKCGVRFDPIIPFYAGTAAYRPILERIAAALDPAHLARFELGVIRFPTGLWKHIRSNEPDSPLLRGEYFRDREGKIRLYRPARVALYRDLSRAIRSIFPDVQIDLSMEERTVWEDAGLAPAAAEAR